MDDPERLNTLLDLTQDKIVIVDESGNYRYVNAAAEHLLGYTPGELEDTNTFEYIHPEDSPRVRDIFEALVASDEERSETVQYRHRARDGSWVWLESRLVNRTCTELDGYVVSSRDITDRKTAERDRRETANRLRELAANTNDVLWMVDADWKELLFINDTVEEIYGIPPAVLDDDPQSFLEAIHPEDREDVKEKMNNLSAGHSLEAEYRVNPARNYQRWVWAQAEPVYENGEVVRIVGFSRDITDRLRRERQLRVIDNLLRHNLRNDMNVILGHAETVRNFGPSEVRDHMVTILETGRSLLATTEKQRDIVEMTSDLDDSEAVDIAELLAEVISDIQSRYPKTTIETSVPNRAEVVARPEIRRALYELLENAAKHADTTPEISIDVHETDDSVEIEVVDNAPTIPKNEFVPLNGSIEESNVFHGTGLGLWLVYWVVDLSDGTLEFDCEGDRKNRISISLPKAV